MRHFGGQCQRVLFREVRILGDVAITRKPIDNQHSVTSAAACDVRAKWQLIDNIECSKEYECFLCTVPFV